MQKINNTNSININIKGLTKKAEKARDGFGCQSIICILDLETST